MKLAGKKILVTGADGFIGSHVVEALLNAQISVRAFCLYNSFGTRGWLDTLSKEQISNIEFCNGDIRDSHSVRDALQGCDVALHLAALIAIPYSYQAPESYIDTNIKGTLNMLQAARDLNIDRIVQTSTSEVYGSAQYVPIDEQHPNIGQSPYAATKIAADQLAISYNRSFDLPVSILRPFNTYGPRQSIRAVIPTIISQLANGQTRLKLGDISPTRDFSFVKDTAAAFLAVSEADRAIGEIVNFGSGFEISIADTASLIARLMGVDIEIETEQQRLRPKASEVQRLYADIGKAQRLLDLDAGFAGRPGFERGLKKTIEWFTKPENLKLYNGLEYGV